MNSNVINHFYE